MCSVQKKSIQTQCIDDKQTDGVAILGQKLKKQTFETQCTVCCQLGAKLTGFILQSLSSYLLSQCKYQSLAPPLSCCELHSAFSSTRLVSSRSCVSCCLQGCTVDIPEQLQQSPCVIMAWPCCCSCCCCCWSGTACLLCMCQLRCLLQLLWWWWW